MNNDILTERRVRFDYMKWLVRTYINKDNCMGNRTLLLQDLFHTRYRPGVGNDANRGGDGLQLRDIYIHSKPLNTNKTEADVDAINGLGDPNMLEVMIGICLRLEDMTRSFVPDNSPSHWMLRLLDNLNLLTLTDDIYTKINGNQIVYDTMETLLNREYDSLGHGSLFPMKDTKRNRKRDYRTVEIWYQMQAWVGENVDYSTMKYANFDQY